MKEREWARLGSKAKNDPVNFGLVVKLLHGKEKGGSVHGVLTGLARPQHGRHFNRQLPKLITPHVPVKPI